ncbi:DJ-1/PfpI family protein [Parachitinimonas caeni]|uniref:DJ-1/PfpI family protein n=1 Tax=Parachitinimonas caeni TaxID=3031301 RepID=A0ABT7DWT4_9NEIS|nr:DJ-1/PfpI family protein [Parachitinimonas caeni]MDK2124532.1 DJ-1/PfpI family protein [Parachitinimonas caeni]
MSCLNVGILLFDDVELLDFAGPYEVFSVAADRQQPPPFKVFTVARQNWPVRSVNGLTVNADYHFSNCPTIDLLVIPGGNGMRQEITRPDVVEWVRERASLARHVMSVCSGARLLAAAGLLKGQSATTHHEVVDELARQAPDATIIAGARFIESGKIFSSAGISAGIDLSLYLVAKLCGNDVATDSARYMEYDWRHRHAG